MAVNVAFVGAGAVARSHLTGLGGIGSVKVVGLFDADRARAEERQTQYGVPRVYGSWRELLDDPAVDCVGVLLPHDLHHQFTVEALAAGKHVVCEKPLAGTIGECHAMVEAARRANRRLFMVQNRIYDHAYEKAADLLRSGAIGGVFLAQTTGFEPPQTVSVRPWLGTERSGGGVLMAQAVHPVYALRWFLGDVTRVSATFGQRKIVPMAAEDTAVATLTFASGAIAELTATFGIKHGPHDHGIFLFGEDGYLEITQQRDPVRPQRLRMISPKTHGDADARDVEVAPIANGSTSFGRMWEDYARAIETDGPARVDALDGLRAVEIVLAAHRSNQTGRAIDLPLAE